MHTTQSKLNKCNWRTKLAVGVRLGHQARPHSPNSKSPEELKIQDPSAGIQEQNGHPSVMTTAEKVCAEFGATGCQCQQLNHSLRQEETRAGH